MHFKHSEPEPRNRPLLDYKYTSDAPTAFKKSYYLPDPPNRNCTTGEEGGVNVLILQEGKLDGGVQRTFLPLYTCSRYRPSCDQIRSSACHALVEVIDAAG